MSRQPHSPQSIHAERRGETDSVETAPSDPQRAAERTLEVEVTPRTPPKPKVRKA